MISDSCGGKVGCGDSWREDARILLWKKKKTKKKLDISVSLRWQAFIR